jgi:hypothetical protein
MPKYTTRSACPPKAPSPTNVNSFPVEGWMMTTRPMTSIIPGLIGKILDYKDYYFKSMHVLCTRAFLVAAISTTVDDGESPLGSTKLNNEMGHNCKMMKEQYWVFFRLVLGLDNNTWANYCSEGALCNMILQDLDAMMYYYDMDWQVCIKPVLPQGNITDMAKILARITPLLFGADACTPCIINKVWGADSATQLVLERPRGSLSLVRCRILTYQKVAINTFYIWLTNQLAPVLPPNLVVFKCRPRTIQQLLLNAKDKWVFA